MWRAAFGHAYEYVPHMYGQHYSHKILLILSRGAVTFATSTAIATATTVTITLATTSVALIPTAIMALTIIIAAVSFCLA